jgi:hypothetical protein
MYGDVSLRSAHREGGPDAGAHQVASDLTHPVSKKLLWNLSGLDLMLSVPESSHSSIESGHHLTVGVSVLAVEIRWHTFKGKRHVDGRVDRTLASASGHGPSARPVNTRKQGAGDQRLYLLGLPI